MFFAKRTNRRWVKGNGEEVKAVGSTMGSEEKVMGIAQLLHFQTLVTTGALFLGIIAVRFLSNSAGYDNISITLIIGGLALGLLIFSADFFIEGAKGLARRGGLPEVVIGLTIVSIGTSLPEILVTTTAAADVATKPEVADFAIGGILGSVFVQITLILGLVVVKKGLKIRESWLKRDGLIMLLAVLILTFFLLTERTLQRWESLILVSLYIIYISWLLMHRKVIQQEEDTQNDVVVRGSNWSVAAYLIMVVCGLAFAVFAAHHLVEQARLIAIELNVPHAVIGTTVSGIGTSLPELTIAMMAANRSQGVAIGTLIGSNITDPLLSIGLAGLVHPLAISDGGFELIVFIIIPFTVLGTSVALLMMRTSYEFKKWEGYTLISVYILFILTLEAYNRSWITF